MNNWPDVMSRGLRAAMDSKGYGPDEKLGDGDDLAIQFPDGLILINMSDDGLKSMSVRVIAGGTVYHHDEALGLSE